MVNDNYIKLKMRNQKDPLPTYWCDVCDKWLSMKDKLGRHCAGSNHKKRAERRIAIDQGQNASVRHLSQATFEEAMRKSDTQPSRAAGANGAIVSTSMLQSRAQITHIFLKNGWSLERLKDQDTRAILKGENLPQTPSLYRVLVPTVRELLFEFDRQQHREGKFISIYFDGTTDVEECIGVVMFYWDKSLKMMHKRLLKLQFVDKPTTGNETARLIMKFVNDMNLEGSVIAAVHDRCEVNTRAMQTLQVMFNCFDGQCISHSISNIGKEMELDKRDNFANLLNSLHSTSRGHARAAWFQATQSGWKGKSMVRWFSMHEMCQRIIENWSNIPRFLNELKTHEKCVKTVEKAIVALRQDTVDIAVEFAAGHDVGAVLVKYCYFLEGEYTLCHRVYRVMQDLKEDFCSLIDGSSFHQLRAISSQYAAHVTENRTQIQLFEEGKTKALAKPRQMFERLFFCCADAFADILPADQCTFEHDLLLFFSLQFIDPRFARDAKYENDSIKKSLKYVTWLSTGERSQLEDELEHWRATARRVVGLPELPQPAIANDALDLPSFWQSYRDQLPNWYKLAMQSFLVLPSSAPVERLFSVLDRLFHDNQNRTLEDTREAAVKAAFDKVIYEIR